TATRLSGLGTVIWPVRGIPVTCCDGRRIRLAHNNCSTVIGSDRMRRPVAGVDAADLVPGHLEAPEGGHLFPGVIAVPGEKMQPVFFFTLDGRVTVRGEDLAVDPVAEWPRVAVVG